MYLQSSTCDHVVTADSPPSPGPLLLRCYVPLHVRSTFLWLDTWVDCSAALTTSGPTSILLVIWNSCRRIMEAWRRVSLNVFHVYRVGQKVTPNTPNPTGRFSKFFHRYNLQIICNAAVIKYITSHHTSNASLHYLLEWLRHSEMITLLQIF